MPDTPIVTVCGLGPGGLDLVTEQTLQRLRDADSGFTRTRRHPSASLVEHFASFDDLYDQADSFEALYRDVARALIDAALERGEVVYAVPGSPLVLERSVRWLRESGEVEVELLPAISFLDQAWASLGIDPVDDGVRLVDAYRFAEQAAGERGPLLVAHAHSQLLLSEMKLAIDADDDMQVVVLQALGTPEENIFTIAWPDLDRLVEADHLTSLFIPEVAAPVASQLMASVELMRTLRAECPWDRAQDHQSLRSYLIEETYEVLDALDAVISAVGDGDGVDEAYWQLEKELGDLWFQILFHSLLASEAGYFGVAEVAESLVTKMVHRHPHVYAGEAVPEDAVAAWAALKQKEGQPTGPVPQDGAPEDGAPEGASPGLLDGIPRHLPMLARAAKVLRRADTHGRGAWSGPEWPVQRLGERAGQLGAELASLITEDPDRSEPGSDREGQAREVAGLVGELLLLVAELGRRGGVEAEVGLRDYLQAAERRLAAEASSGEGQRWWVRG